MDRTVCVTLTLVILILAACTDPQQNANLSPLAQPAAFFSPVGKPSRIYLPHIASNPPSQPTPKPTPTSPPSPRVCGMSAEAAEFVRLLVTDSRQQRRVLRCHPALVLAAQRRAESMAQNDYFGHVDPAGVWPNAYAREAGCALPWFYGSTNNVESITAGSLNVAASFEALARSLGHKIHVFGEDSFFREQDAVGVAVAYNPDSRHKWYWSVIIARCEGASSGE